MFIDGFISFHSTDVYKCLILEIEIIRKNKELSLPLGHPKELWGQRITYRKYDECYGYFTLC